MLAYVAEFIILAVMGGLGLAFWSIYKAPKHLSRILTDEEELKKLLVGESGELMINKFEAGSHLPGEHFIGKIDAILKSCRTDYAKLRNICFIVAILLIGASFFLGKIYLALNILVFCFLSRIDVVEPVQKKLKNDIISIATGIKKWDIINEAECREYCNARPELKLLHKIATEITRPA